MSLLCYGVPTHCVDMPPITQKNVQAKEKSEMLEEIEFVTLQKF